MSEEKIAELNTRAKEAENCSIQAQLELAKLQSQLAPRLLTVEQVRELQTLKGKIGLMWVTSVGGVESFLFSQQIARALQEAGIDAKFYHKQQNGLIPMSGIIVAFPDDTGVWMLNPEGWMLNPILDAFEKAGMPAMSVSRSAMPMPNLPSDCPIIIVFEKSFSYSSWHILGENGYTDAVPDKK